MSRPVIHRDILLKLLRGNALARAEKVIEHMHPADIATLFFDLRPAEAPILLDLLFKLHRAGDTISELPAEMIPHFLELVDDERLSQIVTRVQPDDAILFLETLAAPRRERVLDKIDEPLRSELKRLLKYPPGTAGSVMTPRVLALRDSVTAQAAIDAIRAPEKSLEVIYYLYVVDDSRRLVGVVPIRRLVSAPPDETLGTLMLPDPIAVPAETPQEEVAQLVARYNVLALPVVDEDRHLLGVVTVDDVIDVIQEEATQDMYRLAGLDEEDRVFSPVRVSVRKRLPWMSINLGTAFLAAAVVGLFQGTISQKVVLAAFMPVVAGMGGNMGTQTLTVITRGIALGEFEFDRSGRVILKNFIVGVIIGAVCGGLTGTLAWLWKEDPTLGLVLFLSMVANMAIAGLAGSMVPVLLKRLKQDPAMGGSVLITTFTDVCGFFIFLSVASLLL